MVRVVVCGILENEIKKVALELEVRVDVMFMPARLCAYPLKLKEELERQLGTNEDSNLLVYGKCFPGIDEMCKKYNAERIEGESCYEIVAGERFHQLLGEEQGTYFLLPRLCEAFEELTGFSREMNQILFRNYKRCVFLDTGMGARKCREAADIIGLPYKKEYVGVENLKKRLKDLLRRNDSKKEGT